jgi:nucleoside phosphorylase
MRLLPLMALCGARSIGFAPMDIVEGTLLVIAAESREFSGIEGALKDLRRLDWPLKYARSGHLRGRRWVLAAHGPGPRLAGIAVGQGLDRAQPAAVVSSGYCGGLDPVLAACDIFVARRVLDEALNEAFETSGLPLGRAGSPPQAEGLPHKAHTVHTGTLVSGERVVTTLPEKAALRATTGASAVDMEASAVGRAALSRGLPFFCVRVVTDTAWEEFPIDFNDARDEEGRFSRTRIALAAMVRPHVRVPGLIQLDQRTREASARLGDYLARAF